MTAIPPPTPPSTAPRVRAPPAPLAAGRGRLAGIAWAGLALVIWASWFPFIRLTVSGALGPLDIATFRVVGGTLVLLPLFLPGARALPRRAWREGIVLALCWGAPFMLLVAYGVRLTSATRGAALVPPIMPIFAGLLVWLTTGERPRRAQVLGYAAILAGAGALVALDPRGAEPGAWRADAMLLAASAGWATYTVRLRRSGLTAVQAATLVCLYSSLVLVPIFLAAGVGHLARASATELVLQVLYHGVLVGGLSVYAFNRAVGAIGPIGAAAVSSLVPVVAVAMAVPLLGEVPGPLGAAAVAVIAAGAFTAARPAVERSR